VALLERRWDQTTAGWDKWVLSGGWYWQIPPGAGAARAHRSTPTPESSGRGSPYHQQSALYPVIDQLQRLLRGPQVAAVEPLRTLEAALTASGMVLSETVPLLAAFLSLPCQIPMHPHV